MNIKNISACFCTLDIDSCKEFYIKYFGAVINFDCGWYVNLTLGSIDSSIQFMKPQGKMVDFTTISVTGIMLNCLVDDVDTAYTKMTEAGLSVVMPIEDHPWGDRGFSVTDPIGNFVYIYSDREPDVNHKQFYK